MAEKLEIVGKISIDSKDADQSFKSLKSQLKEANVELQNVADKFGLTSKEAQAAAKKVADLKDRIGDAKLLSEGFNPDAKFKALSGALQGVAGGFAALQGAQALFGAESKDLEKTLVKVQGALAFSQGLNQLGELGDQFDVLKVRALKAFNGIKAAIGSTGIGLLVIALGAIYTYWDDIKGAVSGVSEEQKKLNEDTQKNLKASEDNLKALSDSENSLKLQGKSQREILQSKLKEYDVAIKYAQLSIQNAEFTKEAQVKASQRNKDILEGLLKLATFPILGLLKGIDSIASALGKNLNLAEKFYGSTAKLVFDPEKTAKEGDETIKTAKDKLTQLKKDRDGIQLQINQIDKEARDKKKEQDKKDADEAEKKRKEEAEKAKAEAERRAKAELETEKIIQDARLSAMEEGFTKRQQVLENQYQTEIDAALEQLNKGELTQEEYLKRRNALTEKYNADRAKLNADFDKEQEQKRLEQANKELDKINETINNADLEFNIRKNAIEKEQAFLNDANNKKLLGETEYTKRVKALTEARIKIGEEEKKFKIAQQTEVANRLGQLADLIGKQTVAGKALAIAQATINTYQGVTNVLSEKSTLPQPFSTISRIINIATTVASGIKAVKEIVKVPVPGGGGGNAPSATDFSASAPISPTADTTALPQEQINQLSSANASVRSYVLESDIANNQERIVRLNRAARIN